MSAPHADRDKSEQPCCGDHNHEPCRGCPEGRDAGTSRGESARVVRASEAQVEAARTAYRGVAVAQGCHDWPDPEDVARAVADAVVAAGPDADEVTRLRGEVERLTNEQRPAGRDGIWNPTYRERWEIVRLQLTKAEADAAYWKAERDRLAEVVARVEALADDAPWVRMHVGGGNLVRRVRVVWLADLRAALSGPTPAHTPATATEPAPRAAEDAEGQSGTGQALGGAEKREEAGR